MPMKMLRFFGTLTSRNFENLVLEVNQPASVVRKWEQGSS